MALEITAESCLSSTVDHTTAPGWSQTEINNGER